MSKHHERIRIEPAQISAVGSIHSFAFSVQIPPDSQDLQPTGTLTTGLEFPTPRMPYALRCYAYENFPNTQSQPTGLGGALILVDIASWTVLEIIPQGQVGAGLIAHFLSLSLTAKVWSATGANNFKAPKLGNVADFQTYAAPLHVKINVEYQLP